MEDLILGHILKLLLNCLLQVNKASLLRTTQKPGKSTTKNKVGLLSCDRKAELPPHNCTKELRLVHLLVTASGCCS